MEKNLGKEHKSIKYKMEHICETLPNIMDLTFFSLEEGEICAKYFDLLENHPKTMIQCLKDISTVNFLMRKSQEELFSNLLFCFVNLFI